MKNCKSYRKQLVAYMHGELAKSKASTLERHLMACDACRREYETHRATLDLLGDALDAAPAPDQLKVAQPVFHTPPVCTFSLADFWRSPQFKSTLAAGAVAALFIIISGSIVVFTILPERRQHMVVSFDPEAPDSSVNTDTKPRLANGSTKPQTYAEPQMQEIPTPELVNIFDMERRDVATVDRSPLSTSPPIDSYVNAIVSSSSTGQDEASHENPFKLAMENPLSTFSITVDRAAYANVRRFLSDNQLPPPAAIRVEEMINYFLYDYPQPQGDEPFAISLEVADCPWNEGHDLAMIGLQGVKVDTHDLPPNNLVFLLDVSGSMNSPEKLPLLQAAMRMMTDQLRPQDRVAIVTYAGAAEMVMAPTSDKQRIRETIDLLRPGGSKTGEAGIELAYEAARQSFIDGGNNRIILATDGDFNVGTSADSQLVDIIERQRESGVFLSVLGFGTGNQKNSKLELLAGQGNGNYAYIDDILDARKTLVKEMGGTLLTIAKDVKIQVEFNPAEVKAYRLIGYENRGLADEDFNGDTKGAGELGAGHSVTALYELIPAGSSEAVPVGDNLMYQQSRLVDSDDLLTIKLHYKKPDSEQSKLLVRSVTPSDVAVDNPSENFRFASGVAEFALLLKNSDYKANASFRDVIERAKAADGQDQNGYYAELTRLVKKAQLLKESVQ